MSHFAATYIACPLLSHPRTKTIDLCDDCVLQGECKNLYALVPRLQTVNSSQHRLEWQNRVFNHQKPYRQLTDWFIDTIRDHRGLFCDEQFQIVEAPSFLSLLNPGIDYWMRSTFTKKWETLEDVDRLRRESRPRWRVIGTALNVVDVSRNGRLTS